MRFIINILFIPLSVLYGLILYIRNKLFDWNIIKSSEFDFSVISVGNLAMGGVGKTPHVEYLVHLLKNEYNVALLSRGYKRSTTGFYLANKNSSVRDIGDEPLQYKLKFETIPVAVDEKRVNGIKQIKRLYSDTNVILLDDAYQHRYVKPGVNILITDINKLYIYDNVVPSGGLREFAGGSKRANIIVVSKTSPNLQEDEKCEIIRALNPKSYQKVYFSYIKYGAILPFTSAATKLLTKIENNYSILLLTGIAKADPLITELKNNYGLVEHLKFSDHHNFTDNDVLTIKKQFNFIKGNNKIIITTEKDIMRLSLPKIITQLTDIPIFYIPIEIRFHGNDQLEFNKQILAYVKANSRN